MWQNRSTNLPHDCTMSPSFIQTSVAHSSAFPVSCEMSWAMLPLSNLISREEKYSQHCIWKPRHVIQYLSREACYLTWAPVLEFITCWSWLGRLASVAKIYWLSFTCCCSLTTPPWAERGAGIDRTHRAPMFLPKSSIVKQIYEH